MADTKISALTELTAPVSGDYIPIVDTSAAATKKIDWSIVGSPTITPEHYGCVGDGVADDTVNLQAAIDATIAANGSLKGTGTYRVTSTILISPGTEIIEIDLATGNSFSSDQGIYWDGGNDDVIVEMGVVQRSRISLVVVNGNSSTGLTGILIHNPDDSEQSMNHNVFPYIGVTGCDLAMAWGDFTNDGYASNFDDNLFGKVQFYQCLNGLLIDSLAQDNNVIQYFHSGNAPRITTRIREFAIRALLNGNGFRILNGFCRVDNTIADNAIIDIQRGSFSCDRMSMEVGTDATDMLALHLQGIGRDQSIIRNFVLPEGMMDSNRLCMKLDYRGGQLLEGCNLSGAVAHSRPLTAINNVFLETIASGTHTGAANAAILTDSAPTVPGWGSAFPVDSLIGLTIQNVTDGSEGVITDNDATTITATLSGGTDNDWDVGDEYKITGGILLASGTHDGAANAAVLTDSTQSWRVDSLINQVIRNTTDGSEAFITDNTATTITAALSGGTDNDWDVGDVYSITGAGILSAGQGFQQLVEVGNGRRENIGADIKTTIPIVSGVFKHQVVGTYTGNIFASPRSGTLTLGNLNANRTVVNPTTDPALDRGAEIIFILAADGTNRVCTFQSDYQLAAAATTVTVNANTSTIIKFIFNGVAWLESSRVEGIA